MDGFKRQGDVLARRSQDIGEEPGHRVDDAAGFALDFNSDEDTAHEK